MAKNSKKIEMPDSPELGIRPLNQQHPHVQDERYPGTFFRVPGLPLPGKTTWSLVK